MKDDKVKVAILKGIESKGAVPIAEEIVDEIFSDEAQNQYFIDSIFDDKSQIVTNSDNLVSNEEAFENVSEDAKSDAESNEDIKEEQQQSFGKFKNPTELYKAYCELEREFTKRSQKLKQLESEQGGFASEEQWHAAVDKFFNETPSAKNFAKDIACKIMEEPELKNDKNCLSVALTRVLLDKFKSPEELIHDGQFLEKYVFGSEDIKDRIVKEYLSGVRSGQPPIMMVDGGTQCVAPSLKPRTIQEAGMMFLKNNR